MLSSHIYGYKRITLDYNQFCGWPFLSFVLAIMISLYEDKVFEKYSAQVCDTLVEYVMVYTNVGGPPIKMEWLTYLRVVHQLYMYWYTHTVLGFQ